jgi:ABC-type methionine transport system ATPase subunit
MGGTRQALARAWPRPVRAARRRGHAMAKQRVKLTFPPELITQPVIYNMGRQFDVVTNIRRANVTREQGWVILELSGEQPEIERAIAWAIDQGVRVDPIEGDIVAG